MPRSGTRWEPRRSGLVVPQSRPNAPLTPYTDSGVIAREYPESTPTATSQNPTGALTVAALIRKPNDNPKSVWAVSTSGFALRCRIEIQANGTFLFITGSTVSTSTTTLRQNDGWAILAVSRAAGTTTPRAHLWKAGAWTHENFSGTTADPLSTSGGFQWIASGIIANTHLQYAVLGVWLSELSDGDIETLDDGLRTQAWDDLSPTSLYDFNQDPVDVVPDLIGALDFGAQGRVILDGPAGWAYGLAGAAVIPLETAAATSNATLALTAPGQVILETAAATSSATLNLTAPAVLSLTSAGQSNATLALTAPAIVVLETAAAVASATLALTAPTTVVLQASAGQSSATAEVTIPSTEVEVPLETAAAVSTATLALTAPTQIPLGSAAAVSTATLALTAKTEIPLQSSVAVSTATLALTAQTRVVLGTATATSTATLALTAPATLVLQTSAAVSTATLSLTAQTTIVLSSADAVSSTSIFLTSGTPILQMSAGAGVSTATLALVAQTYFTLTAAALSTASLDLTVPSVGGGGLRMPVLLLLLDDDD